jgi:hypothetical protein
MALRLTVAVLLIGLGGCGEGGGMSADRSDAAVDQIVPEPLPRGATAIRSDREGGIDTRVLLRFDAPFGEAKHFASRLLGRAPHSGEDPDIGHLGSGVAWWKPAAGRGSVGGRADDPIGNRSYRILVVPRGGAMATVWLVAFTR